MVTATQTGSAWDVYFKDRRYRNLLGELDDLFVETKGLIRQGYKTEVVRGKMNDKVFDMQNKFKELGQTMLDEHEKSLVEIQQKEKVVTFDNPQAEMLKRQDLEAKVQLMDREDLYEFIYNIDPDDTGVYELSVYQKAVETRLSKEDQDRLKGHFKVLKDKIMYPFRNNEEYQQLEYEYGILRQYGLQINGQPVRRDEEGDIKIISIQDEYSKLFRNA